MHDMLPLTAPNHFMLIDPEIDPRIRKLRQWGYLDATIPQDQLQMLGIDADPVCQAVKLYQATFAHALDELCNEFHGRACRPDGEMGPATEALMDVPRCGMSDFADAEENARWPDPCVMDITVSWGFAKFPGLSHEQTLEAWDSLSQYEELFEMRLPRRPESHPNARVYADLRALPGSVLAWSMLATNSCSFRAQQAYDSTITWSPKLAKGTVRHEVGHAIGMNHTPSDPDSVMYPSMRGQTELNQTDINQMLQLGYKKRTTPIPPPVPPPPVPPSGMWSGSLSHGDGRQITLIGIPV